MDRLKGIDDCPQAQVLDRNLPKVICKPEVWSIRFNYSKEMGQRLTLLPGRQQQLLVRNISAQYPPPVFSQDFLGFGSTNCLTAAGFTFANNASIVNVRQQITLIHM